MIHPTCVQFALLGMLMMSAWVDRLECLQTMPVVASPCPQLCAVNLVDSLYCCHPHNFLSALLVSLSSMLRLTGQPYACFTFDASFFF